MRSCVLRWAPVALAGLALACGGAATSGGGDSLEQVAEQVAGNTGVGKVEASPGAPSMVGQGGSVGSAGVAQVGGGSTTGGFPGPVVAVGGQYGSAGTDGRAPGDGADCSSPVTRELAPFVARDAEALSVDEELAKAREALLGSWHGFVETPWTEPYQIVAGFSWEGGYTARCEQNSDFETANIGCCRAFYYGSDQNSPFKHWALTSVNADHTVDGDIDIMFCDGDRCQPPAWQGKLRRFDYDKAGDRVRFEFWRDDGYGPLKVELERD